MCHLRSVTALVKTEVQLMVGMSTHEWSENVYNPRWHQWWMEQNYIIDSLD